MNNVINKSTAGKCYLFLAIANLIVSVVFSTIFINVDDGNFKTLMSFLFPQIAIFFVICFLSEWFKSNPFKVLPLKKCKAKYFVIALLLFVGSFFLLGNLNTLFVDFLAKIGLHVPTVDIPLGNFWWFILSVLVIAVLPAVMEETVFRGYILSGFNGLKPLVACLLTAGLFSLFHGNPAQTVYQFVLGFILSYLTVKSGSVYPSILMHFLNNFLALFIGYYFPHFYVWSIPCFVIGGVCLVAGVLWIIFDKNGKEKEREKVAIKREDNGAFGLGFFGVAYFSLLWVMGLFIW